MQQENQTKQPNFNNVTHTMQDDTTNQNHQILTHDSETVLSVKQLKKIVRQGDEPLTILEEVNLAIKSGESCALIGESGSGKSTLLAILAGLDDGSEGEVKLLGHSMKDMSEDDRALLRANAVGFVFQSFLLVPTLSALENVQLPLLLKPKTADSKYDETEAALAAKALLGTLGLEKRINHLPALLSGGEQQRVALARAFIAKPKVLFADEPTGNLDRHTGEKIADLLFELNKQNGTTLILVTHDETLASRCDRQLRLVEGKLLDVSNQFNLTNKEA
ncbi:putative ABC transport system ATP-binding protein [Thorsellia anophelis DSM 18579]|uniref:Putative ABC transport system ATP-binding protein n=2 Tax=Thorsellia anophelis TaxID=336804 RepID=A0A1I0DSF1_9GAMM|nr:putative ABC transport system ATP-binding protein [Thorsellia anophelis DSM 18579]